MVRLAWDQGDGVYTRPWHSREDYFGINCFPSTNIAILLEVNLFLWYRSPSFNPDPAMWPTALNGFVDEPGRVS